MNLYAILAIVAGLGFSHWFVYDVGKDVAEKEHLSTQLVATQLGDEVRAALGDFGAQLGADVQNGISQIKVTSQTTVQNIHHETEVHHVLSDPDCAWPISTLRVRNIPRLDVDPARRAGQLTDRGVLQPATPADGQAASPR